jgi:putative ABC transport system permease protein
MQTLGNDLRYGARMLAKKPFFTITAIVTLALGIGANTAIFSVVDAVLLRSLPYHKANQLIVLWTVSPSGDNDGVSDLEAQDYRARMQSIEDLTNFQSQSVNVTGGDRPERVRGAFVAANFFKFFNLNPIIGRTFVDGEDKQGAPKIAVVNEKMWRERLNGDSNLEGKKLILNGEPFSVVGVITSTFEEPLDPDVEVWMPFAFYPTNNFQRTARFGVAVAHLKPGVSLSQAQAEASTTASQLAQAYPNESAGRGAKVTYYKDLLVGDIRPMLWVLFAAVGVILLIACANLANLLLARGLGRQREIAVRAALGASRWRLIRQLLTEATLLSAIGGLCGVFLAYWGIRGLMKIPQTFIDSQHATLNTRVLLFAIAISFITGWLFGLAPALQLARPQLQSFLKEGSRGAGEGAKWNRLRSGFVVFQVALSLLLLVSAGLLIRSFDNLLHIDVGFKPQQLLSLEYRIPRNKYNTSTTQWNFHRQVTEQVGQIPGVTSVALVRGLPFSGNGGTTAIILPDRELPEKGKEPEVLFNTVTPNYFETIGIPLLKGRTFGNEDQANASSVMVVNQFMAERYWPGVDPVGKQIKFVEDGSTATIVGVVGNAKQFYIDEAQRSQVYSVYSQTPGIFATLVIRTTVEPLSIAEQVRQAVWKVDPDQPMWKIRTAEYLVTRNLSDRKFVMALMGIFAGIALLLSMVGLYGVISYLVNQRTQEIGIRMALGAQSAQILRMVLKQGMFLVCAGVVVGVVASILLTRLMSQLLYQISATDPVTFGTIVVLLMVVAFLACYLPARRATRVDPMVALRYE